MMIIEKGSAAFTELQRCTNDANYKVSIEERADGVAIKRDESTWSPTLRTTP